MKERTQIFILFMDIKPSEYHTWLCSSVNCIKQKWGGASEQAMKKRRQKNVNTEGKKNIKYFKKIHVIESLEIETKVYKKADHFSCHFSHFLFLICLQCYKSYILLYLNFSSTQKLERWLFKNETKVKENFAKHWKEIPVQFRGVHNSSLLIFSFILAKLICVSYYFTFFTHYFCNKIKINSISPLESDNYVPSLIWKIIVTLSCLMLFELWVFHLHSRNNNTTLHNSAVVKREMEFHFLLAKHPLLQVGKISSELFKVQIPQKDIISPT